MNEAAACNVHKCSDVSVDRPIKRFDQQTLIKTANYGKAGHASYCHGTPRFKRSAENGFS